jgi:uncharacterized protein
LSTPELFESNPWWADPSAIERDRNVEEWTKAKFKWNPRLGETMQWDTDVIYVLRGPRQIGKTTLTKLKIRELVSRGTPPRAIFYWACDLIEKPERLAEITDAYLTFSRGVKGRRYIFLDEISSVKDWQKGIKYLYDRGKLKGSTLLLTGSHSIDLRKASENLARRRGDVHLLKDKLPDKILLPMKFCEYAETRSEDIRMMISGQDILKRDRRHEVISQIADGKLPKELEEAFLHLKELNQLYDEYLITGGIPRAINAYVSDSVITKDIYEGYVELLLRDIRRWGGNDGLMRQIVRRVTDTMGSPVSLHNLQDETEISSHNTVTSYLDYLKDSFVLAAIYRLDQTNGSPIYRGEKKVYFEDPFIFHALRSWSSGAEPYGGALDYLKREENVGKLTESVVANHLVRLLFGYSPSTQFDYTTLLFFSQSRRKRELDFAVKRTDRYLPIEVKYQGKIRNEDGFGIIDFQKGGNASDGLLLTKASLESKRSYLEMPVSVFLLLV